MGRESRAAEGCSGWRNRLYRTANLVVKIFGCVIFAGLCWYAMRYTEFMMPGKSERPLIAVDSAVKNLVGIIGMGVLIAALYGAQKRVSELVQYRASLVAVAAAMLWVGVIGFWWICSADRTPVGDQAFVYGAAAYYREGEYYFFGAGGYLGMYPFQLGLIALIELLFVFAGPSNYFAFEVVSVLMAVGIVWLGYGIVKKIMDNRMAEILYCILIMCCVPLVFYTSWVYGELPSIFFTLLAVECLLKYETSRKSRWLVGLVLAVTLAILVRQNSLIFMVALVLAGMVSLLKKMDKRLAVTLVLVVLVPQLAFSGISRIYEIRSGAEMLEGIPKTAWLAMGLQKSWRGNGWYNNYSKDLYGDTDCDPELTDIYARQEIQLRLEEFRGNLPYAVDFFREKIMSQWNEPLYQAIFFNTDYTAGSLPPEGSLARSVGEENFSRILSFADRIQFIVFAGMFCYFAFCVKRDSNILHHIPVIVILGGFFFSIIWEAKARYIFPYFVMMFPVAATGYWQAMQSVMSLFGRKEKAEEERKIIPFKKTA